MIIFILHFRKSIKYVEEISKLLYFNERLAQLFGRARMELLTELYPDCFYRVTYFLK